MVICIGPVCIPVWQLFPVLLLVIHRCWDWIMLKLGFPVAVPAAPAADKADKAGKVGPGADGTQEVTSEKEKEGPSNAAINGVHQRKKNAVIKVMSMEHFQQLKRESSLLIMDFSATWCKPCKAIFPVYEALCSAQSAAVFATLDVDEAKEVMTSEAVLSLPTFKVYQAGSCVDTLVGARPEALTALCNQWVK